MKKVLTLKKLGNQLLKMMGSVSHLKELTDSEKDCFKTAF